MSLTEEEEYKSSLKLKIEAYFSKFNIEAMEEKNLDDLKQLQTLKSNFFSEIVFGKPNLKLTFRY